MSSSSATRTPSRRSEKYVWSRHRGESRFLLAQALSQRCRAGVIHWLNLCKKARHPAKAFVVVLSRRRLLSAPPCSRLKQHPPPLSWRCKEFKRNYLDYCLAGFVYQIVKPGLRRAFRFSSWFKASRCVNRWMWKAPVNELQDGGASGLSLARPAHHLPDIPKQLDDTDRQRDFEAYPEREVDWLEI